MRLLYIFGAILANVLTNVSLLSILIPNNFSQLFFSIENSPIFNFVFS